MESIFGYDELDELIPDLIKLDLDRETIDEWLSSSNPDAELDFHYDFNIAFDVDEWEENSREDIDLPTEVTYDFYSLVDDDVDINSDDYNLDDVIADRLSDDYGYTHFGFEYDVNAESGDVNVYDIKWDISESLKEDYTHFTYKSGANPYIAKTDKEAQRILNKYKGKVKETKKGFYEIDDTKEDSFITESVDNLLTNQEFVDAYKKQGFEGAEIILDWDKKQHTFEEWEELLLNTYLDLEQDLLAQGDFETVKHNRDTYINRIIGDKVLSESRPASEDYKGISRAIDRIIKPKHNETTNKLRFLIREASNLYFYAVNPHAFSSNPYNSSRELINAFRTDLLYVTYIDEYLYEWERELNNSLYNEEELSDIREFVNVLKEIKDIIINETPPKPNYLGDE
jgi:hypothetical protein